MNDLDLISFLLFITRFALNWYEYLYYNNFEIYCYTMNDLNINDWNIYKKVYNNDCMIILQSKCKNNYIILIFDSYDLYNVENSVLKTKIITSDKKYVISLLIEYFEKNNIWWFYSFK